jgi:ElaB/YqjD/DUF883 family membrane-anchored ribosome-binding protein
LDELIDDSEELLTRLADAHDPDIQMLRDRVDEAIGNTRRALARNTDESSVRIRELVRSIDDYVHDYPWLALTTGVLLASTVAYIAGSMQRKIG